jgi:hypothetical protein
LHIAPSIASTFKREFNQAKSTNDIIKNQRVIEIASRSIPVLIRPIEIEIPNNEPEVVIPNA